MISRLVRIKPSVTRSFLHETSFDDIVLYIYAIVTTDFPPPQLEQTQGPLLPWTMIYPDLAPISIESM